MVEESGGEAVFRELAALTNSMYTFDHNFRELKTQLESLQFDNSTDRLFTPSGRGALLLRVKEVIRLLHNFVAAAKTLEDHTRRVYGKLSGPEELPEYLDRVARTFRNNPFARFVQDLREYCQHYKSPNLHFVTFRERHGGYPERRIVLPLEDLASFDRWSAPTRAYLRSLSDPVDILEATWEYYRLVRDFSRWFMQKQEGLDREELTQLAERVRRQQLADLEQRVDVVLAMSSRGVMSEEDIFDTILSDEHYDELDAVPFGTPERIAKALEILERGLSLSEGLKQKIQRLYDGQKIRPTQR